MIEDIMIAVFYLLLWVVFLPLALGAAFFIIERLWNSSLTWAIRRYLRRFLVVPLLTRTPKSMARTVRRCLDLTARLTDWETALHKAVHYDDANVVEGMIDAGADPNARYRGRSAIRSSGETPLHGAASRWMPDAPAVIRLLIDAGANVAARDRKGHTPLHAASSTYSPSTGVAQALIDAGADPTARANNDRTPLHEAAGSEYVKSREFLTVLINAGANPNARDKSGWTPLHCAALHKKRPAIVEALLDAGADPVARTAKGDTPWSLANNEFRSPSSNPRVLDADMEASAAYRRLAQADEQWGNWNTANYFETATPGHVAQGLEERIDPNVTDAEGNTPLHWAARENSDPTVIEVLLNGGADPMIRNGKGEFPLHRAAEHNDNPAIIHALIDREVPPFTFIRASIDSGDSSSTWKFLEAMLMVSEFHSTRSDEKTAVDLEQDKRYSNYVNAKNVLSQTALHLAAQYNDAPISQALIKFGANPDARNYWGETPLHVTHNLAVLRVLLESGADPNAEDSNGDTPLHAHANDKALTRALIEYGAVSSKRVQRSQ